MSYYGKKAQNRSNKRNNSANPEFQKTKYVNERKNRYDYQDDYLREYYNIQESQLHMREIETYSTEDLVYKRNAEYINEYEKSADEFIRNKSARLRQTTKRNNYRQADYDKKAYNLKADNSNNASSKVGGIVSYVNSSLEIVDSATPETLKIQNYSAKKNYQRYKKIQDREDGYTDESNDALNEIGNQVKTYSYKGFKTWKALGKFLWRINWIAGLIYTCVSILLVAIIGILLICSIPNTENDSSISDGQAVAEFAAGEIGNHGSKYNNWRGAAPGTAWCKNFVEYVMNKSGYNNLTSGAGGVTTAYKYYKNHPKVATIHVVEGKSKENLGVTPQPGWLIVFEWADGDKYRDHIGIVESYDPSTGIVTTIEGNTWVGRNKPLRTSVCRVHRKVGLSPNKKHIYAFIELNYPKSK